ncbi:glycosyltransferase [Reichenbachiella ulvae]|uniref:Glycosyltransferase n=1 Tax=Reichenbachiella ulvae TaxID=2980104 RepID=A0ABT3CYP3_9BACT|nr:glycosyltransferase [Reichenbachiella ulvae]MCV9388811.1 glycosyltransferase [Reichenbachiella ulvae]
MNKIKVALISPSQNAYSETFIQSHKRYLDGDIFYYYGGKLPLYLEGSQSIVPTAIRIINKLAGWIRKDTSFESAANLEYSLKKKNIQVVFAEYGPTGMAVLRICQKLKLPLIVHFHGHDASVLKTIENNKSYIPIFNYAQQIIAVSQAMKNKLIDLGCPKEKIIVTPCAPDDSFFEISSTLSEETFVGVGRFVDKKAPYYTILAFKKVLNKHPNAQLILAGDGPLRNVCKNLIQHWGIQQNVQLPGVIKPTDFKELLSNCRAFVQHSITAENGDMEGTPVAVLEASAAGVPVVSTFHAGIPDVIIHQQTGLLSDEHDVETMARHMDQLLSDSVFSKKMGTKGKEHVANHYSMDRHIGLLNKLIQQSLQK